MYHKLEGQLPMKNIVSIGTSCKEMTPILLLMKDGSPTFVKQ